MKLSFFLLAVVLVQVFDRVTPEPVPEPLLGVIGDVVHGATALTGSVLQTLGSALNLNIENTVDSSVKIAQQEALQEILLVLNQIMNEYKFIQFPNIEEMKTRIYTEMESIISKKVATTKEGAIRDIQALVQSALQSALQSA